MIHWIVKENGNVVQEFNDELLALQYANGKNQASTRKYIVECNLEKMNQYDMFPNIPLDKREELRNTYYVLSPLWGNHKWNLRSTHH